MIGIAFLLSTIGFLFTGPSEILSLANSDSIRIIGWAMLSFARFVFELCSLSEIVRSMHLREGVNLDDPLLNQIADLWHTVFCSLG